MCIWITGFGKDSTRDDIIQLMSQCDIVDEVKLDEENECALGYYKSVSISIVIYHLL